MKNVLIIGAAGQIARVATDLFLKNTDFNITLYLRDAYRLAHLLSNKKVKVIEGDVLDYSKLNNVIKGQDIVFASLSGELEEQAKLIISAMNESDNSRIIYISSMGIYNEVPGENYGSVLEPYRRAASLIENSALNYTIIRPAWLNNRDEVSYGITKKGEPFSNPGSYVSRKSVADFVVKVAVNPDNWQRESIGIHYVNK